MPVMKLNDRRELQNSNSSCNQLTCYYPTVFDWEKCTCVITLENCDVPQEVCDDSKQWSVDDCMCVPKSKYCSKREICDLPLVWSWGYCDCKHPDELCKNTLRCQGWQVWDPKACFCAPKFVNGVMLKKADFDPVVPQHCRKKRACGPNQDFDLENCQCFDLPAAE